MNPADPAERTRRVVEQARRLGFDLCGVASVDDYLTEAERLQEWRARGYAGEMRYLGDPRRTDPRQVVDGARSIVVCALNYNAQLPYSTDVPADPETPRGWVSRYAWGEDYHRVVGDRLDALLESMHHHFLEPFTARAYVDTGPVVERVAAKHAGLGWLAKNTCLINEQLGSWLFLGVIVTSLELEPTVVAEGPPPDICGNCSLCIEACPTEAIVVPYLLDARRCISYLTIELRGPIPEELRAPMGRMVFGCDICQDVCPWNRRAAVSPLAEFLPREKDTPSDPSQDETRSSKLQASSLFAPSLEWLASLDENQFRKLARGSALKRAKWRGLVRNACVALGNWLARHGSRNEAVRGRVLALLKRLATSNDAVVAEHARWALNAADKPPI